jgi:soluble lytic murein transglycosylase-like protein
VRPARENHVVRLRAICSFPVIPLFAEKSAHSSAPLKLQTAVAQSGGQERPKAGARALLLTAASTTARWSFREVASVRPSGLRRMAASLVVAGLLYVLMCVGCGSAAQAEPRIDTTAGSRAIARYEEYVVEASRRFAIPGSWLRAVMRIESAGNLHAHSPKGAMGLMQIMPKTWEELRTSYGLGTNPYDPRDNILAGAAYLRELRDRFGVPGFLAAYNAGPERYTAHLATGAPLPAETENYLAALAPVAEGSQPGRFFGRPSSVSPWRSSSLFVVSTGRQASDSQSALFTRPAPPSRDRTVADLSALVPASNALFTRRQGVAEPQ